MSPKPPAEHTIGRYVLHRELASGGMATVHLGRMYGQAGFSRTVAIKRLHAHFAKDRDFAAMFVDEARLAARISHPNVVATLDVEALGDELFLVMEYVAGESLSRLTRAVAARGEVFPPAVVSSILAGVLLGLHAAHEATTEDGTPLGIVHRDVSPQNILVGVDGTARVLDFGVAKAAVRSQITREGQIKGKIGYMPVEQIRSEPIDRRADVYGAAVVLWELLTMRRLFDGEHDAAVLLKVLHGDVPPPSALSPGLSRAIDAVVLRGLARAPEQRFATAHDMAVALEEVMPPASPRKVAEWLANVAGPALEKRAQQVKEIESRRATVPATEVRSAPSEAPTPASAPGTSTSGVGAVTAPMEGVSQLSTVAEISPAEQAPHRRRRSAGIIALAATGAALVVALVLRLALSPAPGEPATSATSSALPSSPSSGLLLPALAATTSAAPSALPAASAEPGASSSGAPSAAPSPKQATGGKGPAGKPTATVKPPSSTGCNPPYTVDARGIRRMKPECL